MLFCFSLHRGSMTINNVFCMDQAGILPHSRRKESLESFSHTLKVQHRWPTRLDTSEVSQDPKSPAFKDQALVIYLIKAESFCQCDLPYNQHSALNTWKQVVSMQLINLSKYRSISKVCLYILCFRIKASTSYFQGYQYQLFQGLNIPFTLHQLH